MSISIASRKAKGRALQQWVARKLGELFGLSYGSDDDACVQSRPMGQSGVDVVLRGEAKDVLPWSIECKSGESFKFMETIKQAKANEKPSTWWLIVHKRKAFRKPVVIMDWDAFEALLKKNS